MKLFKFLGSDCDHVIKNLKKKDIRLKTYPKDWIDMPDDSSVATPHELSGAGFYCSAWQHGCAWIKCYSCPAHAGNFLLITFWLWLNSAFVINQ